MVTIKDIARKLGVSVSTVSRALNDHPDIREDTKQEVLNAMKQFNYTPNALARSLIQKKTYTVGLMVPDITDPFFSAIVHDVEDVLSQNGYQTVYCNTSRSVNKEKRFLSSVLERKMDGMIITPDFLDDDSIELLTRVEIPTVFLRRRPPEGLNIPFINVDHYKGACDAVRYLLSLDHREIGFIGMPEYSSTGRERKKGYEDTLGKHRLEPKSVVAEHRTIESGFREMDHLMNKYPSLTAVFAANDQLAIGALEWLARHDISVPDQMSIIGFDNLEITDLHWIKLTTVAQPRKEMGRQAAEILLNLIHEVPLESRSIIMDTQLVIRNSCARKK